MHAQFTGGVLPVQRLSAVWWVDLAEKEKTNLFSENLNSFSYYKPLANGEKGCYASHIQAWRKLVASTASMLLVLEDDVHLNADFFQVIDSIKNLKGDWDMVKLTGRQKEKIYSKRPLDDGHDLITYTRVPSLTAAYVISRSGAEKLLRTRVPFGRPVDVDLRFWFENDLRIFGVYPSVVALDDTSADSSIWQAGRDRLTFAQRLRKLKMKLQLAWGNAWARPPHVDDTLPAASEGGAGANKA